MATAAEKEALGLSADASEEAVAEAITQLRDAASATGDAPDEEAIRAELQAEFDAKLAEAKRELVNSSATGADPVDPSVVDEELKTVKVRIRAFPYWVASIDPATEQLVRVEKLGRRNEVIHVDKADYARGVRFDAFADIDEPTEAVPEGTEADPEGDAVQVAAWIKESKPTAQETIDEANADVERAKIILEAEHLATGGQPRGDVVDGLTEIIEG